MNMRQSFRIFATFLLRNQSFMSVSVRLSYFYADPYFVQRTGVWSEQNMSAAHE